MALGDLQLKSFSLPQPSAGAAGLSCHTWLRPLVLVSWDSVGDDIHKDYCCCFLFGGFC